MRFSADHDLPGHLYNLEAHRALMMLSQGRWDEGETRLRRLVAAIAEPGQLTRLTLPPLGRLLARRGDDSAAELLDRAWDLALDNGSLAALAPAGLALIESAWLAGDISRADDQITVLWERTTTPGGVRFRGELLRYLDGPDCPSRSSPAARPSGQPASPATGGRRRTSGARSASPTSGPSSCAASPEQAACLEALDILDDLGAVAAAGRSGPCCAGSGSPASHAAANEPRENPRASPIARSTCWHCSRPG